MAMSSRVAGGLAWTTVVRIAAACHLSCQVRCTQFPFGISLRGIQSSAAEPIVRYGSGRGFARYKMHIDKTPGAYLGPRLVTFESTSPGITESPTLVQALRSWRSRTMKHEEDRTARQAIIILVTPRFVHWITAPNWLEHFVKLLVPIPKDGIENKDVNKSQQDQRVDVVFACVDGLAPNLESISQGKSGFSMEGMSIFQHNSDEIVPGLWKPESKSFNDGVPGPINLSSLTFTGNVKDASAQAVTVPLANTLFRNGKPSTLTMYRLLADAKNQEYVITEELKDRNNITINAFLPPYTHNLVDNAADWLQSHIPAIPLTQHRPIANGLGNIVRRVDFGTKGIKPASFELETAVADYLSATNNSPKAIAVWAMVIPANTDLARSLETNNMWKEPQRYWSGDVPIDDGWVGHCISKGAKLCRVLSGGGGWGSKEGLLSLDPQTTYSEVNDARFDYTTGTIEEQQNSALGNLAQEGAMIQFFVADQKQEQNCEIEPGKLVIFGAVPSTIDDVPVTETRGFRAENGIDDEFNAPQNHSISQDQASGSPDFKTIDMHFGCVSESGIFLSSKVHSRENAFGEHAGSVQAEKTTYSKIDLPRSYVFRASNHTS